MRGLHCSEPPDQLRPIVSYVADHFVDRPNFNASRLHETWRISAQIDYALVEIAFAQAYRLIEKVVA
jgi:hypothetical protein